MPGGAQAAELHVVQRRIAVAALAAAMFISFGSFFVYGIRIQYTDFLWLAALVYLAADFFRHRVFTVLTPVYLQGVLVLLASLTFVLVWNLTPAHLVKYAGYLMLLGTAVIVNISTRLDRRYVMNLVWLLLLVHLLSNLIGIALVLFGWSNPAASVFQGAFYFPVVRSTGLTDHPDRSSLVYLVLYGLFALMLIQQFRAGRCLPKSALLLFWLTPLFGLLTLSPFSPLNFLTWAVVIRTLYPRLRLPALVVALVALAATLALSFIAPHKDSDSGSWTLLAAPRTVIQASSFVGIKQAPVVGQGLAARGATLFATGYPASMVRQATDPHSTWLDLLATGGLVLLLGFGFFIFRVATPGRMPERFWWAVLGIWGMAGLVHSLNDERMVFFGLAVGAALAIKPETNSVSSAN